MTRNTEDLILHNKNNPLNNNIKIYKFDPKNHDEFDEKLANMNPQPSTFIIANGFMGKKFS